jgi:two-component system response regulator MprA
VLSEALVLVVDDDPMIRASLGAGLAFWGLRVITAADGVAALEAIDREEPALILLDLSMPNLNGRGVARELARRQLHIPIILLTSAPNAQEVAIEIGAMAWIRKPFQLDRLFESVQRVIRPPS